MADISLIGPLLKLGAPWATSAILLYLLVEERKRGDKVVGQLYELGKEVVQSNGEIGAKLSRVYDAIRNR